VVQEAGQQDARIASLTRARPACEPLTVVVLIRLEPALRVRRWRDRFHLASPQHEDGCRGSDGAVKLKPEGSSVC
jgi:hypothetical protein